LEPFNNLLTKGDSYLLLPGQACLGITVERIHLASGYCGLLGTYTKIIFVLYVHWIRDLSFKTTDLRILTSRPFNLLEGRSRFARLGLFVHITAGFMNPGINNRQVLEIYNASNHPLRLWPGTKICQFVFLKMIGNATYSGIFQENALK